MRRLLFLLMFPVFCFGQYEINCVINDGDKLYYYESPSKTFNLNSEEYIQSRTVLSEPIYNDREKEIAYINQFAHWTHFLDHFETRKQLFNFFGNLEQMESNK